MDHLDLDFIGDVPVLRLRDPEIGVLQARQLQAELLAFLEERQPARLIVLFDQVRRSTSEIVTVMFNAREKLRGWNGRLKLAQINGVVREAFSRSRMDIPIGNKPAVFEIHDSKTAAFDAF